MKQILRVFHLPQPALLEPILREVEFFHNVSNVLTITRDPGNSSYPCTQQLGTCIVQEALVLLVLHAPGNLLRSTKHLVKLPSRPEIIVQALW
jgi:hypothetical protein